MKYNTLIRLGIDRSDKDNWEPVIDPKTGLPQVDPPGSGKIKTRWKPGFRSYADVKLVGPGGQGVDQITYGFVQHAKIESDKRTYVNEAVYSGVWIVPDLGAPPPALKAVRSENRTLIDSPDIGTWPYYPGQQVDPTKTNAILVASLKLFDGATFPSARISAEDAPESGAFKRNAFEQSDLKEVKFSVVYTLEVAATTKAETGHEDQYSGWPNNKGGVITKVWRQAVTTWNLDLSGTWDGTTYTMPKTRAWNKDATWVLPPSFIQDPVTVSEILSGDVQIPGRWLWRSVKLEPLK